MICALIQARQNSKRYNEKIFAKIDNRYLYEWVYYRLKKSKKINKIFFIVPSNNKNLELKKHLINNNIDHFTGPQNNVLKRFFLSANKTKAKHIVRICADNPFICWKSIDQLVNFYLKSKCDYAYNHIPYKNNFPDGIGGEIISYKALKNIFLNAKKTSYKEHVFDYIWDNKNKFIVKTYNHKNKKLNYPKIRLDINTKKDFLRLNSINAKIGDSSEKIIEKFLVKFKFN